MGADPILMTGVQACPVQHRLILEHGNEAVIRLASLRTLGLLLQMHGRQVHP